MKKIDRFILRDTLSDGPAGTVYRAEEILPGDNRRTVALKVLPPIPEGVTGETPTEKRFFAEVKLLAQLTVHPHVVTLYAMGITDGYPWLAMEYSNTTAARQITDKPADPAEVIRLIHHVASGLALMHSLNLPLIHQDLKPANLLVDTAGNYKITDFSLATVIAENRTLGLATVRYAAPEILSSAAGRVGPATDLYALGHIAYEMALGARLHHQQFPAVFEGNPTREPPPTKWMSWHASMDTRATSIHELRRDFPPAISEIIARLMAKRLTDRYTCARDVLSDLSVLRGQPEIALTPPAPAAPPPRRASASPEVAAAAASDAAGIPAAAAAGQRFWVRLRGRISGPFDLATLQRQVKQGQISRFHQVSADQTTWRPASEIEGLYGPTIV